MPKGHAQQLADVSSSQVEQLEQHRQLVDPHQAATTKNGELASLTKSFSSPMPDPPEGMGGKPRPASLLLGTSEPGSSIL